MLNTTGIAGLEASSVANLASDRDWETSFGSGNYLTMGGTANSTNSIVGLITLNVFTEEGIGAGSNFTICKRLRDLYNKITVSDVIFDSPVGPEILTSSPEGKFQTQLRITFEIYEEL